MGENAAAATVVGVTELLFRRRRHDECPTLSQLIAEIEQRSLLAPISDARQSVRSGLPARVGRAGKRPALDFLAVGVEADDGDGMATFPLAFLGDLERGETGIDR